MTQRNWQNFFTAEDFVLANESLNPGISVGYILADKANAILREEIKKTKRVYGSPIGDDNEYWGKLIDEEGRDTHTALLINVQEIDPINPVNGSGSDRNE